MTNKVMVRLEDLHSMVLYQKLLNSGHITIQNIRN